MTCVARLDVENFPGQGRPCQPVTTGRPRHDWSMRLLAGASPYHSAAFVAAQVAKLTGVRGVFDAKEVAATIAPVHDPQTVKGVLWHIGRKAEPAVNPALGSLVEARVLTNVLAERAGRSEPWARPRSGSRVGGQPTFKRPHVLRGGGPGAVDRRWRVGAAWGKEVRSFLLCHDEAGERWGLGRARARL